MFRIQFALYTNRERQENKQKKYVWYKKKNKLKQIFIRSSLSNRMAIEIVTHAPNYHQNRRNSALDTALQHLTNL